MFVSGPDPCAVNPCKNGGICKLDQFQLISYCDCAAGYTDTYCQQRSGVVLIDDVSTASSLIIGSAVSSRVSIRRSFATLIFSASQCQVIDQTIVHGSLYMNHPITGQLLDIKDLLLNLQSRIDKLAATPDTG